MSNRTDGKRDKKSSDWLMHCHAVLRPGTMDSDVCGGVEDEALAPLLLRAFKAGRPLLVVCPREDVSERLEYELGLWMAALGLDLSCRRLPEMVEREKFMPENESGRSRVLYETLESPADINICSVGSLLGSAPLPVAGGGWGMRLKAGMRIGFNDLLTRLVEMDYDDEFEVCVTGEFARRGGIIDVYSPAHDYPARLEFWGDDIESIREFDPATQLSVRELDAYDVIRRSTLPAGEDAGDFLDYFKGAPPLLAVVYPALCGEYLERFGDGGMAERWEGVSGRHGGLEVLRFLDPVETPGAESGCLAGCYPAVAHLAKALPEELSAGGSELMSRLIAGQVNQWLDSGYTVALLGRDEGALAHIEEWCGDNGIAPDSVLTGVANLPHGLLFPDAAFVFLVERELFAPALPGRGSAPPPFRRETVGIAASEEEVFRADIDEGDLVVHLVHGIGIFRGIREVGRRGALKEVMVIEYRDGALVHVPVWQASLVNKYIGSRAGSVALHKLGCKRWLQAKIEAERSVRAFAAEMLKVQALRCSSSGFVYPADDLRQRLFEESFPYDDTPDQGKAAREIKEDMGSARPMDRLLCGDVGYGKTEVAIRAAFKAVMAGRQVAVLVPTTVLAQQHYYSFCERFAGHPVNVEMLSRFRTAAEQKEILERVRTHRLDIVIGTHRLVQEDVTFADLGLVIIDEEQRFGVKQKEMLKNFRVTVDVLTMTATPIPRTLYMSMSGIRDLSTIVTAPNQRLPVHTVVSHYDDGLIDSAIRDEVGRGGQVFYLHNRVGSIEEHCRRLRERLPDIRFGIGHGQMDEGELELVMGEFMSGGIDVLVCTTIIESGLDIPNANTIIIENANRFGLAELYQLRGRVGRCNRQAYAYLLLPKGDIITSDARKRLAAIRRYTHLGAGFKLALRDLEIRGAGNLLGAEQSGHINSIGFDLYCQLLRSTVGQLKGEDTEVVPEVELAIDFLDFAHLAGEGKVAAGFNPEYINSERLRIEAYRRLSSMSAFSQIDAFASELEDRFGTLPPEAVNMLTVTRLRIMAGRAGFQALRVQDGKVLLEHGRDFFRYENGKLPMLDGRDTPAQRLANLFQSVRLICGRLASFG